MRDLRRTLELLQELRNLLSEMACSVDAVIVEGRRDVEALRVLGFSKPIYTCSGTFMTRGELCSAVAKECSRVAILTDMDEEGERMFTEFRRMLTEMGVAVEDFYRWRFKRICLELHTNSVEGLLRVSRLLPT